MEGFRGLGREMAISGGKWCEYHQFGAVIAYPNAMAAPGTILQPGTPKNQHFSHFNGVLVISTKNDATLGVSGGKVGSFAAFAFGHAITVPNLWYFHPRAPRMGGGVPPQNPKIPHFR